MQRELPGTVLWFDDAYPQGAEVQMAALFAGGDLMLNQVSRISGLEPYMIQNWVSRGYLRAPTAKRYTRRQLSRILIINLLRSVLQLDRICSLIRYVNGHLDDESDDTVDDSLLYLWFIRCICASENEREQALEACLAEYAEPFPGAKGRLEQVLRILILAEEAAERKREAERRIAELNSTIGNETGSAAAAAPGKAEI